MFDIEGRQPFFGIHLERILVSPASGRLHREHLTAAFKVENLQQIPVIARGIGGLDGSVPAAL
ncbi:hypothetical protein AcdelDRAFT_1504 [Acidovorax delafieldii 2AN]|jgi:hypothetical protein|uniref:Uncharacterized protein n=1 Tax=Acidovorax delafieldii 2AN TaxID=573060 RepID=C5T3M1_ACIDE|nr:hypothetical protein [Acidovorax delafieldii]EER60927.1 hypothetical protein AcdelDRAFT_1504 [Acidovorax delafieldii 2AN]